MPATPRQYDVRVSKEASSDLLAIHGYIEQQSPQTARDVADRLLRAIESLEFLPHRYKRHRQRSKSGQSIHSMPASSFVIYYRVMEAEGVVRILTVRRGSRRPPKRFD